MGGTGVNGLICYVIVLKFFKILLVWQRKCNKLEIRITIHVLSVCRYTFSFLYVSVGGRCVGPACPVVWV